MHQARNIGREIGTALAVLALYLLTILAPMHHARASQLDLAALGYATIETGWVLCTSADTGQGEVIVSKCPAAGIGKHDLVEPDLAVIVLGTRGAVLDAPAAAVGAMPAPAPKAFPFSARAPPVAV